jgi:hypothetical protein
MTERFPNDNEVQCAWDDYVEAKRMADQTGAIRDGIIAGKLWRRFVYLYADPEKALEDCNVVRLADVRRQRQG